MSVATRLVGAIWLAALAVIGGFTYLQVGGERQRLFQDLERRAALLGEGLAEASEPALARGSRPALERLLVKFGQRGQSLAFFDRFGTVQASTPALRPVLSEALPEVTAALAGKETRRGLKRFGGRPVYVYASPVLRDERPVGALLVALDAEPMVEAEWRLWRDNGVRFLVLVVVLSGIALLIVRITVVQPLTKMARWTKALRRGTPPPPLDISDPGIFGPVAHEVSVMAKSLHRARAAAEEEAALRLVGEALWTEERLKQFVKLRLGGSPLFVVSNREPLSHVWKDGRIEAQHPASGLVTAMEPVMRACGGVWVAQASGDADREMSDEAGRIGLPQDDPRYLLRRVWLSKEEEAGYYLGFANEGLWPLCHIVHTRPQFRPEDWAHYKAVNEKFAAAILAEAADVDSPLILIQDYHFALLPGLIKRERPDARVALFWHIPWPNAEAFGICPWQHELLLGMLGADLVGFHTQYYCNNFLETAERAIEARVEWEQFCGDARPADHPRQALSHQRRPRIRAQSAGHSPRGHPARSRHLLRVPGRWRGAARLHQGSARAHSGGGTLLRAQSGVSGAPRLRPARRAQPVQHRALPGDRGGGRRGGPRGEHAPRHPEMASRALSQATPRPPGDLAVLPICGLLHGHLAPRRHEPGRQGVCLGAARTAARSS